MTHDGTSSFFAGITIEKERFSIKKDQREYKISVYGEFINKQTNFDYDIYMDYQGKYVINRPQDALSGYSKSYTDKNCVIFY